MRGFYKKDHVANRKKVIDIIKTPEKNMIKDPLKDEIII